MSLRNQLLERIDKNRLLKKLLADEEFKPTEQKNIVDRAIDKAFYDELDS